jgi:tight adherence protein B
VTAVILMLGLALVVAPRPALSSSRLRSVLPTGGFRAGRRPPPLRAGPLARLAVPAGIGACVFAGAAHLVTGASAVLPAMTGAVAGGTAGRVLATAMDHRRRDRAEAAQVEALAAIAAEVRAGQRPDAALAAAGLHRVPAPVAGVWALSERSGAPVAKVLDRVEDDLRARMRQRRAVASQLAGARSTAVLLAGLPAVGIALGAAMGADPLAILLGTTGGQAAQFAGVVLDSAGVLWTARIVSAADGGR